MKKDCLIGLEETSLGKNIMLTSIFPILKEKYENIYVISYYSDIFKSCSYVEDSFLLENGSLYQELALREDVDVLWKDPYSNSNFIKKKCHILNAWLEEFGIDKKYEDISKLTPNIDRIYEMYPKTKDIVNETIKNIGNDFILVQLNGGQIPLIGNFDSNSYDNRSEILRRNYYDAQKLINAIHEKYPDKKIINFSLPNEPDYENCEKLRIPYLAYIELSKLAFKVITIDSSLQHIAAGNCKDVTVIWGETKPEHFGYSCNKFICAKNVINSRPYFKPFGNAPSIVKMPNINDVMECVDAVPVTREELQKELDELGKRTIYKVK